MSAIDLDQFEQFSLFNEFERKELEAIVGLFVDKHYSSGDTILTQNAQDENLYLLVSGKVDVIKGLREGEKHELDTLKPGDLIGEMNFITKKGRSATVIAKDDTQLYILKRSKLNTLKKENKLLYAKLMESITRVLANRLDKTSRKTVIALKAKLHESEMRSKLSGFLTNVLIITSVYVLGLDYFRAFINETGATTNASLGLLIFGNVVLIIMALKARIPLKTYGITTNNLKPALWDALWMSTLVCGFLTLVKWGLVTYVVKYQAFPVFDAFNLFNVPKSDDPVMMLVLYIFLYCLFCPLQELLFRGFIQGSCEAFLKGRNVAVSANVIGTGLFAISHLHAVPLLAIGVIPLSVLWGIMFTRSKSIIGCSLSHIIIGFWGIFILGFEVLSTA